MVGLGALCSAVVDCDDVGEDQSAASAQSEAHQDVSNTVKREDGRMTVKAEVAWTPTPKKSRHASPHALAASAAGRSQGETSVSLKAEQHEEEEVDLAKVCVGCGATVQDCTAMEVAANIPLRAWGRRNHWGQFCFYCVRMSRTVWPHMKVPGLLRFIESAENKRMFKRNTLAYISLREEGKCHVDLHMIDNRARLLEKFGEFFANADDEGCKQYVLAPDVASVVDNPVLGRQRLCQMLVDGRRRLGFVVHQPMPANPIALPPIVVADPGLLADDPNDLKLVLNLAANASATIAAAPMSSPAKSPASAKALARSSSSRGLRPVTVRARGVIESWVCATLRLGRAAQSIVVSLVLLWYLSFLLRP